MASTAMASAGTVRLYLPRALSTDAVEVADVFPRGRGALVPGGESILIVDDSTELRRTVVRRLTGLGYKCREAENGLIALELLASGEHFDLLFTDIGLPEGILGHELAKLAMQHQPWLKILPDYA
jgi:hypothetical protein